MKLKKRIIAYILVSLFIVTMTPTTFASNADFPNIQADLDTLIVADDSISDWENATICNEYICLDENGNASVFIYHLYQEHSYCGYIVYDSSLGGIVEYSRGEESFTKMLDELNIVEPYTLRYLYYANEICTDSGRIVRFDPFANIIYDSAMVDLQIENIGNSVSPCVQLPGVSPQLQGSSNCIVAATANLMWYWNSNKISGLTGSDSFNSLKIVLASKFSEVGGTGNSYIGAAIRRYLESCFSSYTVSYSNSWSPSFTRVCSEIDARRPCLVGFKAGSDYSSTYGHMTCCVGYVLGSSSTNMNYILLVDGHSSSVVSKLWTTTYNDFAFFCTFS